jgi:hypothetical protein
MAASMALRLHPLTLTDRRNEVTTLTVGTGFEGLSSKDLANRRPGIVELVVDSGNVRRSIEFSVAHTPTPPWFTPTLERSGRLLLLPANWDLEGGAPIDPAFVQLALDWLCLLMNDRSALPQWTPGRESGVQLDWHEAGIDLEIEFSPTSVGGGMVLSDLNGQIPEGSGSVEANLELLRKVFRERLLR